MKARNKPARQHGNRHRPPQPPVLNFRAEVVGQPDEEQAENRADAELDDVHSLTQLLAQVGRERD